MITGMTTTKIAVSLPAGLVEQAKRAVAEGRASSVSAYVARALEEQAKLDDLASLLDEMLADTGGPLPATDRQARAAGQLCGVANSTDVVDASVAVAARDRTARVITSDPEDLRRFDSHLDIVTI